MTPWNAIKAIAFDVDGVMTDGSLLAMDHSEFVRVFNAKDSFALRMAAMNGYLLAVFTGGDTEGVHTRMLTAGLSEENIFMHCRGKLQTFLKWCEDRGIDPSDVLYIGDDIPDVQVVQAAGIGAAPADAAPEVLDVADYVCNVPGGRGCIREVVEKVMRSQEKWVFSPDMYERIF